MIEFRVGPEERRERFRLLLLVSRLWFLFLLVGIAFSGIGLYYVMQANSQSRIGHLRTALTTMQTAFTYLAISDVAYLCLSLVIGLPFLLRAENKYFRLSGILWLASAALDGLCAYMVFLVHAKAGEIVSRLVLMTPSELDTAVGGLNSLLDSINTLERFDGGAVGAAYVAWGLAVRAQASALMGRLGLLRLIASESVSPVGVSAVERAVRGLHSGGTILAVAGALYILTVIAPIAFLSFIAFLLLLVGFGKIDRAYRVLSRELGAGLEVAPRERRAEETPEEY